VARYGIVQYRLVELAANNFQLAANNPNCLIYFCGDKNNILYTYAKKCVFCIVLPKSTKVRILYCFGLQKNIFLQNIDYYQ